MKTLRLLAGLSVGLLLAGCPGDDSADDGADTGNDTTTSTSTDPTTTTDDPPTGSTGDPPDPTTTDDPTATDDTTTTEPPDTSDSSGGGSGVFAMEVYPIINASCACHLGGSPGSLPMMDAASAYSNLVGVPSGNPVNMQNRVEPGSPDDSFFWHKINHTQAPDEGGNMPSGMPMLPAEDLAVIEQWILDGAPE